MKYRIICGLWSCLFLLELGCYKQSFVDTTRPTTGNVSVEFWQKNLAWGLVSGPDIELEESCPQGIARVNESFTVTNGFVTLLTMGLYSPYTIEIFCASSPPTPSGMDGKEDERLRPKSPDMGGLKPIPAGILSPGVKGGKSP